MICTPDLYYQEFKFQDEELRDWKHTFLSRLDMYYKLDEKKEQDNMEDIDFEVDRIMS
jgi:hypothetical protein